MYWVDTSLLLKQFRDVINNRDKVALQNFGNHLKSIRIAKGLSQQKVELIAGVSKNQVGNIERGEVNVTLISILAISKALGITPKELFDF